MTSCDIPVCLFISVLIYILFAGQQCMFFVHTNLVGAHGIKNGINGKHWKSMTRSVRDRSFYRLRLSVLSGMYVCTAIVFYWNIL